MADINKSLSTRKLYIRKKRTGPCFEKKHRWPRIFKQNGYDQYRRYFQIAGMTVCVESDVSFTGIKFTNEIALFAVEGPGDDPVILKHHFDLPDLKDEDLGKELYRKAPWAISRQKNGGWIYRGIAPDSTDQNLHRMATFNADHTCGTIYSPPYNLEYIRKHGWQSLSLFPTDQIWLVPLLADRNAVLMHSAAAIVNGQGLVFVGHSSAGKSTTMEMLKAGLPKSSKTSQVSVEILCDDRNVLRKWEQDLRGFGNREGLRGWHVHGTWSHGTTADVSGAAAPLRAILFLQQDSHNEIKRLTDRKEIWQRLLATLIRSVVTAEWWQKELDVLEQIVKEVRCYTMRFDKSGAIVGELVNLINNEE